MSYSTLINSFSLITSSKRVLDKSLRRPVYDGVNQSRCLKHRITTYEASRLVPAGTGPDDCLTVVSEALLPLQLGLVPSCRVVPLFCQTLGGRSP